MGTLSEKLFKLGLISEKELREQEARQEFAEDEKRKGELSLLAKNGRRSCDELDSCATIRAFKYLSKEILLKDPLQAGRIIQKAHRFKENRQFIWFMYQVRDELAKLPLEKQEAFLNRAFRKAGWTFETPE